MEPKRLTLTTLVVAFCWAAFRVYVAVMEPLTQAEQPLVLLSTGPVSYDRNPAEFEEASAYTDETDWTARAKFKVRHGENAWLFFDSVDAQGKRVDVAPFTMIWTDPEAKDAPPYVFACESARISFQKDFKMGSESAGRIVAGALDGEVRITGPNGLLIEGRDCVFSEEAYHLRSDHRLTFSYVLEDGVSRVDGTANQLQIDLVPASTPVLGKDMPRIGGVERIVFRRDVDLAFVTLEDGKPRRTLVSSSGPFVYEVSKRLATFLDRVEVRRPTHDEGMPEEYDSLRCRWLALQFEEVPEKKDASGRSEPGEPGTRAKRSGPLARMQFQLLRATGTAEDPVLVESQSARLSGRLSDLRYNAIQRLLVLEDTQAGVWLQLQQAVLRCASVRVAHDEKGEVVAAECLHPGEITLMPEESGLNSPIKGFWQQQLWLGKSPETEEFVVGLEGDAGVVQQGEYGILCDRLRLWVEASNARSLLEIDSAESARSHAPLRELPSDRKEGLPPLKRVLAEGNVAMAGRGFRVRTEQLDCLFEPGEIPGESSGGGGLGSAMPAGSREGEASPASGREQLPWFIRSERIDVRAVYDPASERVDVAELVAEGEFEAAQAEDDQGLEQARSSEVERMGVSGSRLHLLNDGGVDQTLHLRGSPAHLRRGAFHIEGDEMLFDRPLNTARVLGAGLMQIPVSRSVTGDELEVPGQLDLRWRREMVFDGLEAEFQEGVTARMEDNVMRCDLMTVSLNRRIDFCAEKPDLADLSIETLKCENGVELGVYQWDEEIIGVTKGRVSEFELSYKTGEFSAQGPGVFDGWQKGQTRRVDTKPDSTVAANQPAESEQLVWEYTNVRFDGELRGNFLKRQGTLSDRVQILYAPVERALQVFRRDDLSRDTESSRNAVYLGCDELQITLHPWEGRDRDFVQLLAVGKHHRVELEGRLFQGNADTLSYDESKKLFTLKGLGQNKASFAYQDGPGASYSPTRAQMIQVNPARRSGTVQGSDGAFSGR